MERIKKRIDSRHRPSFVHDAFLSECRMPNGTSKKNNTKHFRVAQANTYYSLERFIGLVATEKLAFHFHVGCGAVAAVDWLNGKDVPFGCNANHKMAIQNKCC